MVGMWLNCFDLQLPVYKVGTMIKPAPKCCFEEHLLDCLAIAQHIHYNYEFHLLLFFP